MEYYFTCFNIILGPFFFRFNLKNKFKILFKFDPYKVLKPIVIFYTIIFI